MAEIGETPDYDPRTETRTQMGYRKTYPDDMDSWPIREAKEAYINGRISLEEFEAALEDRLEGNSFSPLPGDNIAAIYTPTGQETRR